MVLAHGAGASYRSPFMAAAAAGLAGRGLGVLRFHFPYMERAEREGRRRPPGPQRRLLATWRAILESLDGAPALVVGGKSMGGRMASMVLAEAGDAAPWLERVRGAVYLGYPLHPPGKPDRLRADHLARVPVPQLFVQGSRDSLATLDRLRPVVDALPDARLEVLEGADHSLARSRKDPLGLADAWLDVVATFVRDVAS